MQCENGFIFAADGDLNGRGTGIRQPDSAEIRAISRSESLLERLTGVIGEIGEQFREGIVVPADAELFIEQCDSVGQQLEEAEGADGGISKTLGGGIIDDEPVGVGIGEGRMASVHHFGDFSGAGIWGWGSSPSDSGRRSAAKTTARFRLGAIVLFPGRVRWWWMPGVTGCVDSACLLRMWQESFPESVPRMGFGGN